ncbi:MAG TPA: cytochrome c-type biogenesis protein [Ktedonobacteraceae bacterium]|jgi:cytochrome c-type biogenesis protein CcmH|nr:cytochrome c-type biogenesis protein [Ktedonobacteraceae bacterium]
MRHRRSLFLLLAGMAVIAAIWSTLLLSQARPETLDQRAHDVASQLKCPVCQDESVADSPSLLASQMRSVIRQQLRQGRSEQQIIQYFVSRYGPQIVWSPPWQGFALLAWLVPIALFLVGGAFLVFTLREWSARPLATPATGEDEHAPAAIDDSDLEPYRAQLERELAAEDPLFARHRTEAHRWLS